MAAQRRCHPGRRPPSPARQHRASTRRAPPRTCSCATSAACCSGDSPSMTGLAASMAPPSLTRTYTSPAAPAATASSARQGTGVLVAGQG